MPIHLDSRSRRRFLRDTAILTLAPSLARSAETTETTPVWALLADTHIAADPALRSRQGICMADHLEAVVKDILREKGPVAGVIIDGDCAYDDGQKGDYETLAGILQPLAEAKIPIHFTLGNHDDRDHFYDVYAGRAGSSALASKHCSVIETPHANWVLLDTLRFVNKVEGEIGKEQLDWLAKFLRENPGKPSIIVGHHYPQVFREDIIPGDEKIKISGLVDSTEFLAGLSKLPAAKAYLYGHSHLWGYQREAGGLHMVNLPPTAYVFQEGKPNGWVRATLGEKGMNLELRCLDPGHPSQGEKRVLEWD